MCGYVQNETARPPATVNPSASANVNTNAMASVNTNATASVNTNATVSPCSCTATHAHTHGEDMVTLTKQELNALITEAARLIAREIG